MPKAIVEFDIFKPYADRLVQGITTKSFGSLSGDDPHYESQLEKLKNAIGVRPSFAIQVHSDSVLSIQEPPAERPRADGFMTNQKGLSIGVKIADCVGVLMFDPVQNAIAAVHSGWRGAVQDIVFKAIRKMTEEFDTDPADLLAAITPSIGPCCLEFTDPKKELPKSMHPFVTKRYMDLWAYTAHRLAEGGVQNIELKALCTKCNRDNYFSHRNKEAGRMAAFIGLK
jgi:polyphenol oxidase